MGRSFPVILARVASIFLAGMLLLMAMHHARAENYDGYGIKPLGGPDAGEYGLKPLPGDAPASPNAGFSAAPGGGFAPVQQQPVYQPVAQAAPQPYQPPVQAAQYQAPASSQPYGYRAGDGLSDGQAAMPSYYPAPQPGTYQAMAMPPQAGWLPSDAARLNPGYTLGPGDKIKLTVYGETDLSGDFTIDGSGQLALPLIGQLRAAGYTAAQLEQTVGSALARGYLKSPRVSVEVSTYRPFYIIGAVNRPGEYPYVNHMTALNAIALAGGFQNQAVESVVFIRREGSNSEVEMPTDRTTQIYPGDVIRVHFTVLSDALSVFSPLTGAAGIGIAAATIH